LVNSKIYLNTIFSLQLSYVSKIKKDALLREAHECLENYKRFREEEAEEEGLNQTAMVEA